MGERLDLSRYGEITAKAWSYSQTDQILRYARKNDLVWPEEGEEDGDHPTDYDTQIVAESRLILSEALRAQAEVDAKDEEIFVLRGALSLTGMERDILLERVRVLEDANKRLMHFAQHKHNCLQNAYGIDLRCTCGFLNALTGGKGEG